MISNSTVCQYYLLLLKVGSRNGLSVKINEFTENPLYMSKCESHLVQGCKKNVTRLRGLAPSSVASSRNLANIFLYNPVQLSLKELKNTPVHREMVTVLNLLAVFYSDHKRNAHYRETGEYLGMNLSYNCCLHSLPLQHSRYEGAQDEENFRD